MLKWTVSLLLFLHMSSSLFALEISINSARENHERFSILHLEDKQTFVCEEVKDDFHIVTKIVCAYNNRPSQIIKKIQNNFFLIESVVKKKTFFLIITPFKKMKLLPVLFDLTKESSLYSAVTSSANHWMIIGYKDTLPLMDNRKTSEFGINFPFYMQKDRLPFVGGLDLKGNPVSIKKVADVSEYLKIKQEFQKKNYDSIIDTVDELLVSYPNTLFKSELLYYKIKVYSKLKNYDNVIATSKEYLREYSSDDNIPEILSLTARAYAKNGIQSDADYFFDRLFSEHKDSVFSQWGYIYKADMSEAAGGTQEAIGFYEKAINSTQDLDVAAMAAYKLARITIGYSHKDAAKYIEKIAIAKPDLFANNLKTSRDMMETFADVGDYTPAVSIAKALYTKLTPSSDEYEGLLKNVALWTAKTDKKKVALEALNKYIKEFPDGDFISEVQTAKDALFFDTQELNSTSRLAQYNKLIQEYENDSIGNRAIYEKAKFLLENSQFDEVLVLKDELLDLDKDKYSDTEKIILDGAIGVMQNSLEKKQCHEVLSISNDYNVSLSDKWDDGIYECAMKGGDYELAKSMANKHFKSSDLSERKKWLYRYVKIDFQTGNYSDALNASKDLIALIDKPKVSPYKDVYRYMFDIYERLEQNDNVIASISKLQEVFGVNYKDLDRYMVLVNLGHVRKDDNMVIKYGTISHKIQSDSKSNPQSPFLEFTLFEAYINQEKYNDALAIIESLNPVEINKTQRARQKYLLGTVYMKLWRDEDATKAYEEAIKADESSPWAKLAQSALKV